LTFSVQLGGWRLIGLDSHIPGEVAGRIDPDQFDWLRAELAGHSSQPTALFLHHPPIEIGSLWMDAIRLQNGAALADLVTQSLQVRFVSCGHLHYEYQSSIGHASFFTTPATSVQFDPAGATPTLSALPPGYRVFELGTDSFRTAVVRLPANSYRAAPD
jgi:Icc protein